MRRQQRHVPADNHASILRRTQQFLNLGMRQRREIEAVEWCSTDLSFQNQALRIISEFVASLPPDPSADPRFKAPLESVLIALRGLLDSQDDQVQRKAASESLSLISRSSSSLRTYDVQSLFLPLLRLVSSGLRVVVSAAAALRMLIEKSKAAHACGDDTFKAISDNETIKALVLNLEKVGDDPNVFVAAAELLAVILERMAAERIAVGSSTDSLRTVLLKKCMSSSEPVVCASLKLLSSLALCSVVANLTIQDFSMVLEVSGHCFTMPNGKVLLLHFLLCLLKFSKLLSLVEHKDFGCITKGCLAALKDSCFLQLSRQASSPGEESFSLLAANTVALLLSVPGKHRMEFLQRGLISILSSFFLRTASQEIHPSAAARKNSKSQFYGYMWESLGWIGYYCNNSEEAFLFESECGFQSLLNHLSATFLKTIFRCGHTNCDLDTRQGLQVSQATLLVLSSASKKCSFKFRDTLELDQDIHQYHSLLMSSLYMASVGTLKLTTEVLETRLYMLSIFCCLSSLRGDIYASRTLEALTGIIEKQRQSSDPEWPPVRGSCPITSKIFKPCCSQGYDRYKGQDGVLFAAVWGITSLLRLQQHKFAAKDPSGKHVLDLLLSLARHKDLSQGTRWLAASGLASFSMFGFPSSMGDCWKKVLDDGSFSDVRFVFPDGSCLHAHRVVLAARCPALLPADDEKGEVRVSSRVGYKTMKGLFTYIYTGTVHLEREEVASMKLLAKKCQLPLLLALLEDSSPRWEKCLEDCSMEAALSDPRFSDAVLRSTESTTSELCSICDTAADHIHAHRAVLSSRNDYLEALFRSGMRESSSSMIEIHEKKSVMLNFTHYLYTDKLPDPSTDCAWRMLSPEQQWEVLERLIDLAGVADKWLDKELETACIHKAGHRLNTTQSPLLWTGAMRHAAARAQWDVVAAAAERIAPHYLHLQKSGALEGLDDKLVDMLRVCYVKSKVY